MTADEAVEAVDAMIGVIERPDLTYAVTSTVDQYMSQMEESFNGAVDPNGEAWEPIVYRAVPPPPLDVTGALKESALSDIQTATVDKLSFATSGSNLVEYAEQQDEGTFISGRRYVGYMRKYGVTLYQDYISWHPGRPFIGMGENTLDIAAVNGAEEAVSQLLGAF
mgnify:FL=1